MVQAASSVQRRVLIAKAAHTARVRVCLVNPPEARPGGAGWLPACLPRMSRPHVSPHGRLQERGWLRVPCTEPPFMSLQGSAADEGRPGRSTSETSAYDESSVLRCKIMWTVLSVYGPKCAPIPLYGQGLAMNAALCRNGCLAKCPLAIILQLERGCPTTPRHSIHFLQDNAC